MGFEATTVMYKFMKIVITVLFSILCTKAIAHTECLEKINSLYVGDDGYLWMTFQDGGVANMKSTDIDFQNTLSLLLAAKLSDSNISIRYASDSATCSESRSDIKGVWLK